MRTPGSKGMMQASDDLIDPIVYQLYGLTEDEIAIVRERTLEVVDG